jgi:DNA polymerase-3 subunit alpha
MELIPSFINRKHGKEKVAYLHAELEPILKNTYGIGVYQEQMMRIARDMAGFTLAEADTLRKAIGKKIKSLLDEQKDKIIKGMVKNGIEQKTAKAIWELFPPFARYGFNKSHAACYALIGYQTAYLKAHYRQEFMTSLLNAELSNIERAAFLIQETRRSNIEVLPPDINRSGVIFTPETFNDQPAIRFGLLGIKNVGSAIVHEIIDERGRSGPFADLNDFLGRIQHKDLNKKSMESLVKCGAFDSMGLERGQLLGNMEEINKQSLIVRRNGNGGASLFANLKPQIFLKLKETEPASEKEKLNWEKDLLGFFLSDHPLNRFASKIKEWESRTIDDVCQPSVEGSTVKIIALVASVKKITTRTGQPMAFAQIEDFSSKPLEVVVFNYTFTKTAKVWEQNQIIYLKGKMSWRNGEPKMLCENAVILT